MATVFDTRPALNISENGGVFWLNVVLGQVVLGQLVLGQVLLPQTLGLEIHPQILATADEVIE